jgi:predicted O-methyltransferase YrrM
MSLSLKIKRFINKLPHVRALYAQTELFKKNSLFPPGHFYSPIVSVDDIRARQSDIWEKHDRDGIAGVDLQATKQLELLEKLATFYDDMPFLATKQENLRYYFENNFYSYTDGTTLFAMIRHLRPKRIIEIGSGFSSAVMLDTNEQFFDNKIALTFVEPYPQRLYSLLTEADKQRTTIIEKGIQSVPLDTFAALEANDILFVDSTHVSKTGSDVNYILFEILPVLKPGVMIHFHDVFYPFEYPKAWVFAGHNWNEDYILKAFLMYNTTFEITLFSEYIHRYHPNGFAKMPLTAKNFGGNLWIEKMR